MPAIALTGLVTCVRCETTGPMKAGAPGGLGVRCRVATGPMKRGATGPTNAGWADGLGLGLGLACLLGFFALAGAADGLPAPVGLAVVAGAALLGVAVDDGEAPCLLGLGLAVAVGLGVPVQRVADGLAVGLAGRLAAV